MVYNKNSKSTRKNPTVFLYAAGRAQIDDTPEPEITHPTDAIVRIKYVGVCGSDVSVNPSAIEQV